MQINIEKIILNLSPDTIRSIIDSMINDITSFKMYNNHNLVDIIKANEEIIESNWNIPANEIYSGILESLSYNTDIFIDYNNLDDYNLYLLTSSMYDISISGLYNGLTNFVINYIQNNKNSLYKILEEDKFKKSRDVDLMYNSELISDKELALILSKIEIIFNIIFNIEISDIDILTMSGYNSERLNCILNYTNLNHNLLMSKYKMILQNDLIKSMIMNDIKLHFHNQEKFMTLNMSKNATEIYFDENINKIGGLI